MRLPIVAVSIAVLFAPTLALAGGGHPHDPELASLRRQMMAAKLVHALRLTPEQRRELRALAERARRLRNALEADTAVQRAREALKETLRQAIEEVRQSGRPRPQTRVWIETLRDQIRDARRARRGEWDEIARSMKETLTEEQLEALRELKRGRRAPAPMRKRRALWLLTSDEFLAELAR